MVANGLTTMTHVPTSPTIFLHIPKTGGTSIRRAVERSVGHARVLRVYSGDAGEGTVDVDAVPDLLATNERPVMISGHLNFGVHRTFGIPRAYVTVIREPAAQLVSAVEHYRRATNGEADAQELLTRPSKRFDNPQMRHLLRRSPPAGRLDESHYRTAEANLRACLAVGTTERLEETAQLFGSVLGLSIDTVTRVNVRPEGSTSGMPIEDLASHIPDERLRWDRRLHRLAATLLDEGCEAVG